MQAKLSWEARRRAHLPWQVNMLLLHGLVSITASAVSDGCPLLTAGGFVFQERQDHGAWRGSVQLAWQAGTMVTISFHTNAEITKSEHAMIVRASPRTTVLQLLGLGPPDKALHLEGAGGCWQNRADMCTADVTCERADSPSPPPSAPHPSFPPPYRLSITPRVVSTTCHSVQLAWDSPLPPDQVSEYLVQYAEAPHFHAETMKNAFEVPALEQGTAYHFQIGYRVSGDDIWSQPGKATEVATSSVDRGPSLPINVGHSTGGCTSLRLGLPEFGKCSPSEYLSVDWRVARTDNWKVVMDRIDVGDLPSNILSVDQLDSRSRYEFRVKLHQVATDGGRVIEGPSTGALLVDMRSNELRQVSLTRLPLLAASKLTFRPSRSFRLRKRRQQARHPSVSFCQRYQSVGQVFRCDCFTLIVGCTRDGLPCLRTASGASTTSLSWRTCAAWLARCPHLAHPASTPLMR